MSRSWASVLSSRPRYVTVLFCLLVLVGVAPLVDALGVGLSRVLSLYGAFVAVLAVSAASDDVGHRRTAFLLAGVTLLVNGPAAAHLDWMPLAGRALGTLAFLVYSTWRILNAVRRSRVVNADVLAGALSAYLMVGLTWSVAWGVLEVSWPGSLRFPDPHGAASFSELVYFSFITLLTIGYGDIVPAGPLARSLAVFEGLAGLGFTTVLISFLVAKYIATGEGSSGKPDRPDSGE